MYFGLADLEKTSQVNINKYKSFININKYKSFINARFTLRVN